MRISKILWSPRIFQFPPGSQTRRWAAVGFVQTVDASVSLLKRHEGQGRSKWMSRWQKKCGGSILQKQHRNIRVADRSLSLPNRSTISCWSVSLIPPWRSWTWLSLKDKSFVKCCSSQFRVSMRSEKITRRSSSLEASHEWSGFSKPFRSLRGTGILWSW